MIIRAYAKINLFLEILGKRPDGFHEIDTVMAPISLHDSLRITSTPDPNIRLTGRFELPIRYRETELDLARANDFWGEKNLVWRAAKLLQEKSGQPNGCSIELIKRIPSEAGLGGASSDAAATIIGLNRLWNLGLSHETQCQYASQIGSDVPFFLQNKFARCRGRGEKVESIERQLRLPIVICKPPTGLSTAKVYANYKNVDQITCNCSKMLRVLNCANARKIAGAMHNGLETSARALTPWISRISYQFSQLGSLGHQMSGSGTSYFGLFANPTTAQRATRILQVRLPNTFVFMGTALTPRRY